MRSGSRVRLSNLMDAPGGHCKRMKLAGHCSLSLRVTPWRVLSAPPDLRPRNFQLDALNLKPKRKRSRCGKSEHVALGGNRTQIRPRRKVSVVSRAVESDKRRAEIFLHLAPNVVKRKVLRALGSKGLLLNDASPFSYPPTTYFQPNKYSPRNRILYSSPAVTAKPPSGKTNSV